MAKRINIYLANPEFKWIKNKAKKENRSVSNYIQTLIIMDRKKDAQIKSNK